MDVSKRLPLVRQRRSDRSEAGNREIGGVTVAGMRRGRCIETWRCCMCQPPSSNRLRHVGTDDSRAASVNVKDVYQLRRQACMALAHARI